MSITQDMLDAVLAHLKATFGKQLAVEYFPDAPQTYRLNHPVGAVLLMFSRSRFSASTGLGRLVQPREVTFTLTVVFRKLNGAQGAVPYLDALRAALVGFRPPQCQMGLAVVSEDQLGHVAGLWQYRHEYSTQSVQIEVLPDETGTSLIHADFEDTEQ